MYLTLQSWLETDSEDVLLAFVVIWVIYSIAVSIVIIVRANAIPILN